MKIEENKIESPNIFYCLKKLNLRKLNIKGNPVCNKLYLDYRKELFNNIKTLEAIDDIGKNNETVESTEYGENEEYCEKEEFQSAESDEENNNNKIKKKIKMEEMMKMKKNMKMKMNIILMKKEMILIRIAILIMKKIINKINLI